MSLASFGAMTILSVPMGLLLDKVAMDATERRGDEVLADLRREREAAGECPADLASSATGRRPLIRGQREWRYFATAEGDCQISYHGPFFLTCRAGVEDQTWFCD